MDRHLTRELKEFEKEIRNAVNEGHMPFTHHINFTQMQIVHYLLENNDKEVCQKDFEAFLGLNKASISGSLDSLEDKGLIKRTQSTDDARKKIITLSEEFMVKQEHVYQMFKELDRQLISGISEEELVDFYKVLDKIKENFKLINLKQNEKDS